MTNFSRSRIAHAFAIGLGLLAFSHVASAQLPVVEREQRLRLPPDAAPQPPEQLPVQFGRKLFTDGQTTIVTVDQGRAAYAYARKPDGRWVYQAALEVPAGMITGKGGAAILGDTALVLARDTAASQNFVLVFSRSSGVWTHTQTLPGGSASIFNDEGSVAIGSDFIALGDPSFNGAEGALHIYNAVGAGTYVFDTTLQMADAYGGSLLGINPAIQGNTLIASAPGYETLVVFDRTGGVWSETARLGQLGQTGEPVLHVFGFSGNRVVVTKPHRFGDPSNPEVFVRTNGVWTSEQELVHPDDPQGRLGQVIAMDGRRIVVDDALVGDVSSNKVVVYERDGSTWTATAVLEDARPLTCIQSDPNNGTRGATAIGGRWAFWSCPTAPTQNEAFEGKVYVYKLPALD
jgi:hypothetical protein